MLYSEIIAVCSQIYTKHINTLCGQNVAFLIVKPVRTATTGLRMADCALRSSHKTVSHLHTSPRPRLCYRLPANLPAACARLLVTPSLTII
jgi:hypothetical protein